MSTTVQTPATFVVILDDKIVSNNLCTLNVMNCCLFINRVAYENFSNLFVDFVFTLCLSRLQFVFFFFHSNANLFPIASSNLMLFQRKTGTVRRHSISMLTSTVFSMCTFHFDRFELLWFHACVSAIIVIDVLLSDVILRTKFCFFWSDYIDSDWWKIGV